MTRLRDICIIFLLFLVIGVGAIGIALGEFGPRQTAAIIACVALAFGVQQVICIIAHGRELDRRAERIRRWGNC